MSYVSLGNDDVAWAALLILVNALVSFSFGLKLEKTLLIASVRTVVQLTLVGMVLSWVFAFNRWYVVIGIAILMTVIAGHSAASRSRRTFPGLKLLAIVSVWSSAWLMTGYVLFVVFRDLPRWYEPQYAIPLLGMVLGNSLNGISVGLNAFTEAVAARRDWVETQIALGATRREAAAEPMREAIRAGMIPIINSMMVVGLVSLPGMMTGQIVSGMQPSDAVRYQIVIMFLIASATAAGTFSAVYLAMRKLFTAEHRYRYEVLR